LIKRLVPKCRITEWSFAYGLCIRKGHVGG